MTEMSSTSPDVGANTEYGAKRDRLAHALLNIGTGLDWEGADSDVQASYMAAADEVLNTHRCLLSPSERNRLVGQFPHLS